MSKLDRESQLLEVARELILEDGMVSFKFADIGKRAKVSRATLYKHFSGKEDVLARLFIRDAVNTRQMLIDIQDHECLNDREKLVTALLAPIYISSGTKNRLGIAFLTANPAICLFEGGSQQSEHEQVIEQLRNIHIQFWMIPMRKGNLIATQEQVFRAMGIVYPYQRGCVLLPKKIITLGNYINRSLLDVYENMMLFTDMLKWRKDHESVDYDKLLKVISDLSVRV
ncbi:TetR/AcrR family transcriptional regulator [Shewanella eurypsychrophilus]|uniref:TetR/AcrR family transcriptional regulator n=2 Tax=Shewanella eurypsychrophilus TaxID=2593656 RepID=A0ABX6VEQ8_9GAMM|nr:MULTISPECIES: TetR/AcrR family transcriptional regulator [Shewanella]QFU24797.1 TetR family transcriptional regulator [Shewanella sp. YLB-09]QPG59986.2 TetR/AcrR family transcriptional regulator [Shewanella eurypsychrophilus]